METHHYSNLQWAWCEQCFAGH